MCKRWYAAVEFLFPLRDVGGTGGNMTDEAIVEGLIGKVHIFSAVGLLFLGFFLY